jgi:hypothetical protein
MGNENENETALTDVNQTSEMKLAPATKGTVVNVQNQNQRKLRCVCGLRGRPRAIATQRVVKEQLNGAASVTATTNPSTTKEWKTVPEMPKPPNPARDFPNALKQKSRARMSVKTFPNVTKDRSAMGARTNRNSPR